MRKDSRKILLGAATVAALTAGIVKQADAALATMTAKAVILQAIAASATIQLQFGNLTTAGPAVGTIKLDAATGTRTVAAGTGLALAGGAPAAARGSLNLTGQASAALAVSISVAMPVLVNGVDNMTMAKVTVFQAAPANNKVIVATGALATGYAFGAGGAQTWLVGGELTKGAAAIGTGTYTDPSVIFNIVYN